MTIKSLFSAIKTLATIGEASVNVESSNHDVNSTYGGADPGKQYIKNKIRTTKLELEQYKKTINAKIDAIKREIQQVKPKAFNQSLPSVIRNYYGAIQKQLKEELETLQQEKYEETNRIRKEINNLRMFL